MTQRLSGLFLAVLGLPLALAASAPPAQESGPQSGKLAESSGSGTATSAAHPAGASALPHRELNASATSEEIASLLRLGSAKREKDDFESAEMAYLQVLAEQGTPEQDREAVLGLARTYRKKGDHTRATAVYERFIKNYPSDPELPAVYLEQGRTLRALGAYKQAIARFYSVLNSTLKLPDDGGDSYRQLARTAQYEIAETHFQTGNYSEATRFFSRLKLLDLAPEDRAKAHFKSVVALSLLGDEEKAVQGLRLFLDQNPDDENVPEARYLLSVALRRLGRSQEALVVTLDLLKTESGKIQTDPRRWAYWQRKTGNQLGNEFYEHGDFNSALQIYESLSRISEDPAWRLPVTYQTGLCYERLRRFDRARACYQTIVDNLDTAKSNAAARPDLMDLADMAAWRLSQLSWQESTDTQISAIFKPSSPVPSAAPAGPATASASDNDHDTHGRAPFASQFVR